MTPDQSETLILDVRDRLARIEVKIDNTNEKLRDHDGRITRNTEDIESLKDEVAANKTKMASYVKAMAAIGAAGGVLAWFIDHATTVVAVASAVPH